MANAQPQTARTKETTGAIVLFLGAMAVFMIAVPAIVRAGEKAFSKKKKKQ